MSSAGRQPSSSSTVTRMRPRRSKQNPLGVLSNDYLPNAGTSGHHTIARPEFAFQRKLHGLHQYLRFIVVLRFDTLDVRPSTVSADPIDPIVRHGKA